ncbi:TRAP transporter substrate-binding protein [Pseudooceanicola nanhaiensis]|jgi:TRAP-type C4-dicarboxylate transport system substrate-binding protein|uniref:C4-dicarboxylate ABC transporter n=1 Tax=Pseudooceanicola nanhaiensis TaxID=375761 RepID=A0A917SXN3_9RHOB|nr:C4-dicarboxylate ABC transporter [Pseudooceanicola nanhaiensis]
MTIMKTLSRGLAIGAAATLLGTAAFAQEVTLKMHQFLPAQASVPKHVLDVWADKVEADSDGRIKIERYPSMQLGGKPPELVDQVLDGVADIVWTLPGYTPGRFPSTEVFELPFMETNAEATSRAYWQLAEKHFMDTEFGDLKMLGLWVHGPGLIHSSEPVTEPADLNGVKLRAPTRVTNQLFTGLGATTVGLPVPAVPEALSKGVIDATVIPWEVTASLKVGELVKNHTEFGDASLYTATFIFAMNKDKYEALPDDLKKVIDDNSGEDFSAFAGKVMQDYDAPARQVAVDLGNNIIELTPEQVQVWRDASAGVEKAWVEEMSGRIDAQALVDEARALIEENTK